MVVRIKQNDTRPGVTITCTDAGTPVDLTAATALRLIGTRDGSPLIDRAVTGNPAGEVVVTSWEAADTDTVGLLRLEVEATWSDGTVQTFPADGWLLVQVVDDLG